MSLPWHIVLCLSGFLTGKENIDIILLIRVVYMLFLLEIHYVIIFYWAVGGRKQLGKIGCGVGTINWLAMRRKCALAAKKVNSNPGYIRQSTASGLRKEILLCSALVRHL